MFLFQWYRINFNGNPFYDIRLDQSTTLKIFSSTWKLIKCTSKLTPVCIQIWRANEPELWRTFNHRFISEIMTQDYLNFIKVNIVDFRSSTSFMCIVFVLWLVLRCMIKEKQLLLLRNIQSLKGSWLFLDILIP